MLLDLSNILMIMDIQYSRSSLSLSNEKDFPCNFPTVPQENVILSSYVYFIKMYRLAEQF